MDRATGTIDALVMAKLPRDEMRAAVAVWKALVELDAFDVGVLVSRRYIASKLGIKHLRRAGTVIDRLVERGVLRVTRPAAGSRARACTFDDIARWQGVSWGIEHAESRIVRFKVASGELAPPKPRFVALPRAPQDDFAALARPQQKQARGARTCATNGNGVAHARAPQTPTDRAVDTIPSELLSTYLPTNGVSELAKQVFGRVQEIQRPGTFIARNRKLVLAEIVDAVGDAEPFFHAFARLPRESHALAYADSIEETAAVASQPTPEPSSRSESWVDPHAGEPAAPPPWLEAPGVSPMDFAQTRYRFGVGETCETDDGGAL